MDKPAQKYSVDELSMPLDHHLPKIISQKGQKKVHSKTCASAAGHSILPFVIFDVKELNLEWTKEEVVGTEDLYY